LEIYLDTNDSSKVPEFPPAFGVLTAVVEWELNQQQMRN
jgi:hypothetical protein